MGLIHLEMVDYIMLENLHHQLRSINMVRTKKSMYKDKGVSIRVVRIHDTIFFCTVGYRVYENNELILKVVFMHRLLGWNKM